MKHTASYIIFAITVLVIGVFSIFQSHGQERNVRWEELRPQNYIAFETMMMNAGCEPYSHVMYAYDPTLEMFLGREDVEKTVPGAGQFMLQEDCIVKVSKDVLMNAFNLPDDKELQSIMFLYVDQPFDDEGVRIEVFKTMSAGAKKKIKEIESANIDHVYHVKLPLPTRK